MTKITSTTQLNRNHQAKPTTKSAQNKSASLNRDLDKPDIEILNIGKNNSALLKSDSEADRELIEAVIKELKGTSNSSYIDENIINQILIDSKKHKALAALFDKNKRIPKQS